MTLNSYKLIIKKLENYLSEQISLIDTENTMKITFNQLGRLLSEINLFQLIKYDANYQSTPPLAFIPASAAWPPFFSCPPPFSP